MQPPPPQQEQQPPPQQQQQQHYTLRQAQEVAARLRAGSDVLRGGPRASKDDPGFVDTFYRASRLHFIGTWRARIEGLLGELEDVGPDPLPPSGGRQQQQLQQHFLGVRQQQGGERGGWAKGALLWGALPRHVLGASLPRP